MLEMFFSPDVDENLSRRSGRFGDRMVTYVCVYRMGRPGARFLKSAARIIGEICRGMYDWSIAAFTPG